MQFYITGRWEALATQALTIKGDKSGIKILVNATFTFSEILQDLEKKFIQNTKFFEGAAIKLESNTLEVLSEEQFSTISNVMTKNIINPEGNYGYSIGKTYIGKNGRRV